ncbi:uncharacterized protein LOC143852629 isoform X2 [Tasmannia lanceolata]|uniref:uncharacterized protein LOC143852629 isoform X2 n=1 Tax=Tasmannia lanceolata TaxID=3420 RepID=UPI004062FAC9
MSGKKDKPNAMDHKKRRTMTPVWRPVSTQSSSYEGYLEKDEKTNLENPKEKAFRLSENVLKENLSQSQCSTSDPKFGETISLEQIEEDSVQELSTGVNVHLIGDEKHSTSIECLCFNLGCFTS